MKNLKNFSLWGWSCPHTLFNEHSQCSWNRSVIPYSGMYIYFGFYSHTQGKSSAGPAAAAGSSSGASSSGPGCSDGSFRAGKGPGAGIPGRRCMLEMSMELGFWWFLMRGLTSVIPCIKGIWSSMLFLLCLESEAGFHWQPLCACSLSQVGTSVACTDTGMHMSKTVSCGHTTSLTVGTWSVSPLLSLNSLRWLLCCVNWFLYCESLPAIFNHMWFTLHLHILTIKKIV